MLRDREIRNGRSKKAVILIIMTIIWFLVFLLLNEPDISGALSAGNTANATYEGALDGVDNQYYRVQANGSILFYNSNGTTYTQNVTDNENYIREYLILTNLSTNESSVGYCVEFGAKVVKGNSYTSSGYMQDALYFRNLPEDVKQMMLAAVYYGRNGTNNVPVSGADDEDFYFATQVMIWEIQQQIRVFNRDASGNVIGTKTVDSHGMAKNYFYRLIAGRAAEKCYDYLIQQIGNHFIIPDFVGETPAKAKSIKMKYSMITRNWHADLKDTKNTGFEFSWSDNVVKQQQNGNSYSFSSTVAINGDRVIKIKRKTKAGSSAENLLIWNSNLDSNQQVMATGSAAPAEFYMKLETDIPAEVTVEKKDEETGKPVLLSGTEYKIKSIELDMYVSEEMKNPQGDSYFTDRDGKVTIGEKLQAGRFILEEIKAPKGYVVAKEPLEFQVDGQTAKMTVTQNNIPQKGIITIKKIGEYRHNERWDDIRDKVMGGIDFDIVALADIITPDGTMRAKKGDVVDTVRTDFNGNVSTKALYLGPYNVVEKDAPVEYRISEPINIALVYEDQNISVVEKKVNILNRLKRSGDSFGNTPKTGDDNQVNTAIMTLLASLTLIAVMSVFFALRKED